MNDKKSLGQAIDELTSALKNLEENSRPIAIRAVCELLNIENPLSEFKETEQAAQSMPKSTESIPEKEKEHTSQLVDIRTLKSQKSPRSAVEMACVVAYYLEYKAPSNEKKNIITKNDIDKYFKQAGYPAPKVPSQVLRDAKASGYFDSKSQGNFVLNPVGYNLVVHSMQKKTKK